MKPSRVLPGRLLSQNLGILDDEFPKSFPLLQGSVLQRVERRERRSEMDLATEERGTEVVWRERLIHVPVKLWVGDGQTQSTWNNKGDDDRR